VILSPERRSALTAKAKSYAGTVDKALPYLLARGITAEVAAMFTLGYAVDGEFAKRLTIPYVTPAGVVQIKYRCADPAHHDDTGLKHIHNDCPKYLLEAGTGIHLFNAQVLIYTAETVVVTEGELDAICVQAYTGIPAVAYPGADTWKKQPHYRLCFEGVSEVIVVADGDKVGKDAAKRVAESIGMSARTVEMPAGQDSNSYIASEGAGAYLERLR
jgi:DNA primase